MTSAVHEYEIRNYQRQDSVVFKKTKEDFGALSNMATGFALRVNGILIGSTEAMYQACRCPHEPSVQRLIIEQESPMSAKEASRKHISISRPDWNQVKVEIMQWCLKVKLVQHWDQFGELLLLTGRSEIVEESRRDTFWGARPEGPDLLIGKNVLGRLLMDLREIRRVYPLTDFEPVTPVPIQDFLIYGKPIENVGASC